MFDSLKGLFASALSPKPRYDYDGERVRTHPLLGLPQELLDNVVDFLDTADAACLSMCNKSLYQRLGTNRWQLLRLGHGHDEQRKQLLTHIARDNPHIFYCHICSYLHLVARLGPSIYSIRLPCINSTSLRENLSQAFETYGGISSYRLTFPYVQLVMARHRDGPKYGISMSSISITEVRRRERHKVWTLLSVEPKIVDNELFLRVQQWIAFDQDDQPTFERLCGPSICTHISKIRGDYLKPLTLDLLQCQVHHIGRRASCPKCSVLYRCIDCGVEYESDAILFEDRKLAVVITKWLNVGNGDSPTNPDWRRHLYSSFDGWPVAMAKDSLGPRSIFEGHIGRSQDTATRENASLLRGESFRKKLHRIDPTIWSDQI